MEHRGIERIEISFTHFMQLNEFFKNISWPDFFYSRQTKLDKWRIIDRFARETSVCSADQYDRWRCLCGTLKAVHARCTNVAALVFFVQARDPVPIQINETRVIRRAMDFVSYEVWACVGRSCKCALWWAQTLGKTCTRTMIYNYV